MALDQRRRKAIASYCLRGFRRGQRRLLTLQRVLRSDQVRSGTVPARPRSRRPLVDQPDHVFQGPRVVRHAGRPSPGHSQGRCRRPKFQNDQRAKLPAFCLLRELGRSGCWRFGAGCKRRGVADDGLRAAWAGRRRDREHRQRPCRQPLRHARPAFGRGAHRSHSGRSPPCCELMPLPPSPWKRDSVTGMHPLRRLLYRCRD